MNASACKLVILHHPDGAAGPHGPFVQVVGASRAHGIFLGLGYREATPEAKDARSAEAEGAFVKAPATPKRKGRAKKTA